MGIFEALDQESNPFLDSIKKGVAKAAGLDKPADPGTLMDAWNKYQAWLAKKIKEQDDISQKYGLSPAMMDMAEQMAMSSPSMASTAASRRYGGAVDRVLKEALATDSGKYLGHLGRNRYDKPNTMKEFTKNFMEAKAKTPTEAMQNPAWRARAQMPPLSKEELAQIESLKKYRDFKTVLKDNPDETLSPPSGIPGFFAGSSKKGMENWLGEVRSINTRRLPNYFTGKKDATLSDLQKYIEDNQGKERLVPEAFQAGVSKGESNKARIAEAQRREASRNGYTLRKEKAIQDMKNNIWGRELPPEILKGQEELSAYADQYVSKKKGFDNLFKAAKNYKEPVDYEAINKLSPELNQEQANLNQALENRNNMTGLIKMNQSTLSGRAAKNEMEALNRKFSQDYTKGFEDEYAPIEKPKKQPTYMDVVLEDYNQTNPSAQTPLSGDELMAELAKKSYKVAEKEYIQDKSQTTSKVAPYSGKGNYSRWTSAKKPMNILFNPKGNK